MNNKIEKHYNVPQLHLDWIACFAFLSIVVVSCNGAFDTVDINYTDPIAQQMAACGLIDTRYQKECLNKIKVDQTQ